MNRKIKIIQLHKYPLQTIKYHIKLFGFENPFIILRPTVDPRRSAKCPLRNNINTGMFPKDPSMRLKKSAT